MTTARDEQSQMMTRSVFRVFCIANDDCNCVQCLRFFVDKSCLQNLTHMLPYGRCQTGNYFEQSAVLFFLLIQLSRFSISVPFLSPIDWKIFKPATGVRLLTSRWSWRFQLEAQETHELFGCIGDSETGIIIFSSPIHTACSTAHVCNAHVHIRMHGTVRCWATSDSCIHISLCRAYAAMVLEWHLSYYRFCSVDASVKLALVLHMGLGVCMVDLIWLPQNTFKFTLPRWCKWHILYFL